MGWQCAILGQLVGTTKIHDGCREQNFCMYTHALWYEKCNGTIYNNVRLCPRDHNSTWPPFSPTIVNIEHNLIAFCYINMIFFCPFLCFTISGLKRSISTDVRPRKPSNIQNGVILAKQMQVPRFCAYCYVLAYGQEHSTGIYLYCLNYT